MHTRTLAIACGLAISTASVSTLSAQQTRDRDQPTSRTPEQDRTNRQSDWTSRSASTPSILSELEGVWRVEVSMHPTHWKSHKGGGDSRILGTPEPRTRDSLDRNNEESGRDPNRNDPNNTNPDRNDPNNPNRNDPNRPTTDRLTPGTVDRGTPGDLGADAVRLVGFAETRLVLGENFLQETIVLPNVSSATPGSTSPTDSTTEPGTPSRTTDRPNTTPSVGDDTFRSMSFLTFDEASQRYSMVCMDSRKGEMHYDTGTFDASSRKIEFTGGKEKNTSSTIGTPERDSMTGYNAEKHGKVRVVLEILGPDEHRVTMYKTKSTTSTTTPGTNRDSMDRTNTPGTPGSPRTPATPEGTQPRDGSQPRDGTQRDTYAAGNEEIVYRATYTRVRGSDAQRYQQMLEQDRSLSRATDTDR